VAAAAGRRRVHRRFTDVLLRRGAAHVIAVVSAAAGRSLRTDPRVTVLDRHNVGLSADHCPGPVQCGADLSFISLTWCCRHCAAARNRTPTSCSWSNRSSRQAGAARSRG
jgi:predicted rRNA methylase YqxC with S4 and FtsJ domains